MLQQQEVDKVVLLKCKMLEQKEKRRYLCVYVCGFAEEAERANKCDES